MSFDLPQLFTLGPLPESQRTITPNSDELRASFVPGHGLIDFGGDGQLRDDLFLLQIIDQHDAPTSWLTASDSHMSLIGMNGHAQRALWQAG